jgi:hypothetical protein
MNPLPGCSELATLLAPSEPHMTDLTSAAAELGIGQLLAILLVGGVMIIAISTIWSAIERYLERLAQRDV